MKHPEFELQTQVCRYISAQYPHVLFSSDTIAFIKLTGAQAGRNAKIQKKGFKAPDIVLYEARHGYHGLFIELKIDSPFKRDGALKKSDHLEGQARSMQQLKDRGYYATFAWDFDMIKNIIDRYLS